MLFSFLAVISLIFSASVAAQSNPSVVCVAGQCLQGFTNATIGSTISVPGAAIAVQLLPGQYTSDTNPQLLHTLLTSSSATLSSSPGFNNSTTVSLPLTIALQAGIAAYPNANYSGSPTFTQLPETNGSLSSTSFSAGSLMLSSNAWAAISSSSSSTDRLIVWDSIPDLSQLPPSTSASRSSLSILDIQSAACSPPCSGAGICSASGTCTCPIGFTGSSCESCASGFFGPNCQPCPQGCTSCDEGISGTGRCLSAPVVNPPSSCNCLNGVCGSNGQCTCNAGWTNADNGTACAKCAQGFFLTSDGNCQACQLGCTQCADQTGDCIACKSGFTQDANDRTKCAATQSATSTGTVCPDGSFSNGTACTPCSPLCQTCTGATSNDCIICGAGKYSLNGNCVAADGNGVCQGSSMIADNNKHECDSCPSKCTSCKIPNFNVASTVNQLQCTGCLPGFVLSQGKCVSTCPSGTFLNPQDNLTCTACDSSCGTCAGSATFCLTCANNQLASNGKCVSSCPSNTFSSSGSCISCHPDCASCSGSSFNQCSSCPQDRPVLTGGRCLPTCSKSQYFDKTSSSCQSCDSSCSSCSGSGPNNCLACSNSNQILRGGSCVSSTCSSSTSIIPGLGLCLSDLVAVPVSSGTSSAIPLPTVTGIDTPIAPAKPSSSRPLAWWEILLMALGCAFIFLIILMLWRRRARKRRAQATIAFAVAKNIAPKSNWRWRLIRFGERLFGHKPSQRFIPPEESEHIRMAKLKAAEEARHERDMDKLLDAYDYSRYSRASTSRAPSPLPSLHDYNHDRLATHPNRHSGTPLSAGSIYSQVTGMPRKTAEPRQPVRNARDLLPSRFSRSSYSNSTRSDPLPPPVDLLEPSRPPTPAQEYARLVSHNQVPPQGSYWLQPTNTGSSNASRNPFRR
ncbi:unnamed protein product [Somion occarium]|uniref:EGF-like domain-containing protein n=1 Tax=Somion occarium TaxID=3059160 RepID=A0ABP1D9V2_9APHY